MSAANGGPEHSFAREVLDVRCLYTNLEKLFILPLTTFLVGKKVNRTTRLHP
jgi:hypothetical protein